MSWARFPACPRIDSKRITSGSAPRAARTSISTAWRRSVHAQSDAPYARGRLMITARGQGRFTFEVIHGTDKWVTRS